MGRLFILLLLLCSCTTTPSTPGNYSFYILARDGKEYIVQADSLDKGMIFPEKEGALLNSQELDRDMFVKGPYYYHIDRRSGYFSRYRFDQHSYTKLDSVDASHFYLENFCWVGKDTLLLTGLAEPGYAQARYMLLKTDRLAVIAAGNVDIPPAQGRFTSVSVGFTELRGRTLLMGYTYHQKLTSGYTTSDTLFVTKLSFPDMKRLATDKDTRSTYPGGMNTIQPYSFNDEAGNFYFMTCPGIALGNRTELPTGIFRILKRQDQVDKDYFFNTSAAIHNHGYGMWYLGDHKAIMRCERKDLFKGLNDHYNTPHFEFYIVDLFTQQVKKLDLPLDKGTRRQCVIVENGIAWITVNSDKEGCFVWQYDIQKDTLKKGLRLAGTTDFMMRMDPLH